MQDNTTSLLFRQSQCIDANRVLVVNPVDSLPSLLISEGLQVTSWYLHAGRFANAHDQENAILAPWLESEQDAELVIFILPKEKALTDFIMLNLASSLKPGTPLLLLGSKDTGVKSQLKRSHTGWAPFEKLASGNHCQLLRTCLQEQQIWSPDKAQIEYTLSTPEHNFNVVAYPGVFSPNRLDEGTKMLLSNLPTAITGKVLDFGCGTGIISLWLLSHYNNLALTLSDVNPLAIASSRKTLSDFKGVEYVLSDGLTQVEGRFDWIITNPPFHTGKRTDYTITRNFVKALREHMMPGGTVILVANSFLPYKDWLAEEFSKVSVIDRNTRFTLYQAEALKRR